MYVGISLENIITPTVSAYNPSNNSYLYIFYILECLCINIFLFKGEVEEEKEVEIVKEKEKKEVKKSKSWGRRSTRAKKCISYRYIMTL